MYVRDCLSDRSFVRSQSAVDVDDFLAQRKEEDEKLPDEDEAAIIQTFEGGVKARTC